MAVSKSSDDEKLKRRRRTLTVYKMVFNEEPNPLIWEENVVSQPSSHVILRLNTPAENHSIWPLKLQILWKI